MLPMAYAAGQYVRIPGREFRTALPAEGSTQRVASFQLRTKPVTNREFSAFVARHPEPVNWLKDRIRDEVKSASEQAKSAA